MREHFPNLIGWILVLLGALGVLMGLGIIPGPSGVVVWFGFLGLVLLLLRTIFAPKFLVTPELSKQWKDIFYWGRILFAGVLVLAVVSILPEPIYEKTLRPVFANRLGFLISFTLASFFPISAIAYLLFQRQSKIRMLAGDFWLLGIDIRGIPIDLPESVESIRLPDDFKDLAPKHYYQYIEHWTTQSHGSWNYIVQSIPAIFATIIGLSLFSWTALDSSLYKTIIQNSESLLQALRFGFIGAYIYSLQLVYRRYTTLDLQPNVYTNCMLTLIAGLAFNFVAFKAITNLSSTAPAQPTTNSVSSAQPAPGSIPPAQPVAGSLPPAQPAASSTPPAQPASGLEGGILAIIAFSLGYFPYLAVRWFNRIAYSTLGVERHRADALHLGLIDGISQFHETRLRDEGIDNIQNLASVRLDELLMNTRFSAQQVIDWVDQACLYLYLESSEIEIFRRGGIRTLTDFQKYWGDFMKPQPDEPKLAFDQRRKERALQLQSLPERLDTLYLATDLGPNVAHIKNYWAKAEQLLVNAAPKITSADHATFTVGSPDSFQVKTTGFPAPAVSVEGTLPAGVEFDPAAMVLRGIPAPGTGGNYKLTLKASNDVGSKAQEFTLTVNEAPSSPA